MLTCQKHLFSIPDEVSYLNCSYMSPTPEPVEMAGYQAIARKTMPYEILVPDFFEPVARLKSLFAQLINVADPERIAIIPSVSYGISSVVKTSASGPASTWWWWTRFSPATTIPGAASLRRMAPKSRS